MELQRKGPGRGRNSCVFLNYWFIGEEPRNEFGIGKKTGYTPNIREDAIQRRRKLYCSCCKTEIKPKFRHISPYKEENQIGDDNRTLYGGKQSVWDLIFQRFLHYTTTKLCNLVASHLVLVQYDISGIADTQVDHVFLLQHDPGNIAQRSCQINCFICKLRGDSCYRNT